MLLPMFPLGNVLLPGMVLPLHVFEERYRNLVRDCLDGSGDFGVVLIAQGAEVGGGDSRTGVGTRAAILEALEQPDGRWHVLAVGIERIRVHEWLPDAPYPCALVEPWPDEPRQTVTDHVIDDAIRSLSETLALAQTLGFEGGPLPVIDRRDPSAASFVLSSVSPLGPPDRHDLLCASGAADRFSLLGRRLADQAVLLGTVVATLPDTDR